MSVSLSMISIQTCHTNVGIVRAPQPAADAAVAVRYLPTVPSFHLPLTKIAA